MAQDQNGGDSVYDFLYIDARRIANFVSQFGQYGHLTSLTRTDTKTGGGGGEINIGVAKLDGSGSAEITQIRQFDPQWIAPLTFLDEAEKKGMIVRGLDAARIGQLVLVTGDLAVFDLALFKAMWPMPQIQKVIMAGVAAQTGATPQQHGGNRAERRRQASGHAEPSPHEAGFEVLKLLPHALLATISHGGKSIWSSLRENDLIVSASDLMLKHGVQISGAWNMVGILDALPETRADESDLGAKASRLLAATSLGTLGVVIAEMVPHIRTVLGRPASAYGMTPLLIFREVTG